MKLFEKIAKVQQALKAPKDLRNSFGNYNYRSCESILEAVKPHLSANGLALFLSDEIVDVNGRFYVRATATVVDTSDGEQYDVSAWAREEESKKGMDSSQVTGASSSYARKYALNGLFAIDDNKDSDATNTHGKDEQKPKAVKGGSLGDQIETLIKTAGDNEYAVCADCGKNFYAFTKRDGSVMSVRDMLALGLRDLGKPVCKDCYKAALKS